MIKHREETTISSETESNECVAQQTKHKKNKQKQNPNKYREIKREREREKLTMRRNKKDNTIKPNSDNK